MNLTTKIALLLLLQLLGAVTGLAGFTSYLARTEHEGHVINVAGRQRMLAVQIRAYVHMVSIGQEADREGLVELARTFDAALGALREGGTVMGGRVPPAQEGTRDELSRVVAAWTPLKPRLAIVAEAPRSEARFSEASRYAEAHAEELRAAADGFVRAYELRARRLQERMLGVLVGVVCFSVVLLLAGIFLSRRYIVRPVRRLDEVARAIGGGDFSMRLEVSTHDELSALARCFNEMSSQLQQTLADLERQRRRAMKVVSSVPSGLALLGGDMTVLKVNPALCGILCATSEEVVGRHIAEVLPLPGLPARIEDAIAEGEAAHGLLYTLEQEQCPARALRLAIVGTRHAQQEDEEAPVLLVVDDLSEEERLRARARASDARFREVVEHATDGIVIMDREGLIRYFNRAAEEMFGRDRDAVLGQSATLLMPEKYRTAHEEGVRRHLLTGASRVLGKAKSIEGLRADGSVFPVEVTVAALGIDGDVVFTGVLRDVTERQQLMARMMQMDRMIAVGTLAAGVGHEINNPLTYVIGNLSFALEEIEEHMQRQQGRAAGVLDSVREVLGEAQEGAGRIRDIVRDLRTFSRAEDEARGAVDIRKVLESAINMGFHEIRHRARLVKDFSSTLPVQGNESRLGQVFLNLLINAAHAIPEGEADTNEIRIRTSVADGRVVVEVADTGSGISPADLPRIFDPFFTTKPVGQGTGLGLSICRKIIEAHGGEIDVRSEVGVGSTFRVLLAPVSDEESVVRPIARGEGPSPRGRILAVDDDAMVGRIVCRTLESEHEVVAVASGRQAFERLGAGERFDIILCDVMMPEMTGMDLYDRLRETMPEAAERMVFLTGGAFSPRAREFLDRIDNSRIDKPFSSSKLRDLVRGLLRGRGSRPRSKSVGRGES